MFQFYFLQFTADLIHFIYQSVSFIFILFGCTHITWSFNLIASFTFQSIPSLEINDLQVSLDKFLILYIHYLQAELRWFYALSLHIKPEIQHGAGRNVLVCSTADIYISIYSNQAYVGKQKNIYTSENQGKSRTTSSFLIWRQCIS